MNETVPRYWGTGKGRIIRAISLEGARSWDDIIMQTGFSPGELGNTLNELISDKLITKRDDDTYRVERNLFFEYRNCSRRNGSETLDQIQLKDDRNNIVSKLDEWLERKKIIPNDNHYFLEGSKLYGLTDHLIGSVRSELLIINPFVDMTNIIDIMKEGVKNGVKIKILTRPPEGDRIGVINTLSCYGMEIFTNKSIHAKIFIFDRGVALISSMNLYAYSVGGGSWEAGIITSSLNILNEIITVTTSKFEEKETTKWNPNNNSKLVGY